MRWPLALAITAACLIPFAVLLPAVRRAGREVSAPAAASTVETRQSWAEGEKAVRILIASDEYESVLIDLALMEEAASRLAAPTASVEPTPPLREAAAVGPLGTQLGEDQVRAFAAAAGFQGASLDTAVAIAKCESGWWPNATGSQGEMGLWQIHPRWHPDATYDPLGNARAAYRISGGGADWSAWTCARVLGYR